MCFADNANLNPCTLLAAWSKSVYFISFTSPESMRFAGDSEGDSTYRCITSNGWCEADGQAATWI